MTRCLVIGAGVSGLTAARKLHAAGMEVLVLDKGRGVGGRMATRRIEDGVFDHGAQFITVRSKEFGSMMEEMIQAGAAYEWYREPEGHPRYQATGGMTAIPKHLAKGLDVRVRHRVAQVKRVDGKWHVQLELGQVFEADLLISTAPVPQALDWFDLGRYEFPEEERAALDKIRYERCIAMMLTLDGPSGLPKPGFVKEFDETITYVCDNQMKGISPNAVTVTVHTTGEFSLHHWTVEDKPVMEWLQTKLKPLLHGKVQAAELHRWRFAKPVETHPERCLSVSGENLLFAGDAFAGPRVEGAALSGLAAANAALALV